MSNVFVTADSHFHHANIIKYTARPFKDVDEMDEAMVDLWNQTVKPEDVVYHLGDFYWLKGDNWYECERLMRRLHGKIHLIKGDHDPGLPQMSRLPFASLQLWLVRDDVLMIHNYETRAYHSKDIPPYKLAFSGHVHRHWLHSNVTLAGGVALNVGVDLWHFRPVSFEQAVACQTDWLDYCRQSSRTPGDVLDA